jgi:hypothetical protein
VIQQAKIVVGLDVELVGRKDGEIVLQRLLMVPEVVIANGELEVIDPVIRGCGS